MKNLIKIGVVLTLTLITSISLASEISISSDSMRISQDRAVTNYSGNVVMIVEKRTKMRFESISMHRNRNKTVLEGDVRIEFEKFILKTERAIIISGDLYVTIKMDSARSLNI